MAVNDWIAVPFTDDELKALADCAEDEPTTHTTSPHTLPPAGERPNMGMMTWWRWGDLFERRPGGRELRWRHTTDRSAKVMMTRIPWRG